MTRRISTLVGRVGGQQIHIQVQHSADPTNTDADLSLCGGPVLVVPTGHERRVPQQIVGRIQVGAGDVLDVVAIALVELYLRAHRPQLAERKPIAGQRSQKHPLNDALSYFAGIQICGFWFPPFFPSVRPYNWIILSAVSIQVSQQRGASACADTDGANAGAKIDIINNPTNPNGPDQ